MTKILLVEDDKSLREIYSVRLLAEGYTLISSGDGEEALAEAISEKPDLIISDVMMPKISGFEMLDLLRSNESTRNIPVIMLTALSSEQQRDRGTRLGADRYLIKSQVGIEDIVRTVHEVLGDGQDKSRSLTQLQESIASGQQTAAPQQSATAQPQSQPLPDVTTNAASDYQLPQMPQPSQAAQPSLADNQPTATVSPMEPVVGNPSITGSNFPEAMPTVTQQEPANFQSAFNPPAATEPAAVAGQSAPELPDTPMSIPSRMVQQPGMPSSYSAAAQTADNMVSAAQQQTLQQVISSNPATEANYGNTAMTSGNDQPAVVGPFSQQPIQTEQPAGQISQPSTPAQSVFSSLAAPQQPSTPTPAQVTPLQQQVQAKQTPATNQYAATPQQPEPMTAVQQPLPSAETSKQQPAQQISMAPQQQPLQQASSMVGGERSVGGIQMNQPANNVNEPSQQPIKRLSGMGGERVISPISGGTGTAGPKINIDELLASADASAGTNMFPTHQ